MEGEPVQIINIEKEESTQKSTYIFKFEALHEVLSEVKDKEVAVISIGGPSRQGKSFLLSYLLRFYSNPSDNNWIGKNDDPLEGFSWNHGIEPETKGVWIWSKPIIFKPSVGKEMAILIMDTQGVYDEYTDMRDWSTIVGLTLLTSSCFIFNVFTDIQENVLTQLETFVNYGLLAISKDDENKHAFQRLLFLIRDWNHARDFNYGYSGGKQYITQKLSIKSNQPQPAQRTRKQIRQCFEDVTCYLMPEPGSQKDKEDFNGSVSQLNSKFVEKLKELFSVLLNPNSIKPKIINGNTINGRDLLKFFEVFVEKFNGDEFPQPIDLVEAVAKATDLNLIFRLKEKFISEMTEKLHSKPFIPSTELDLFYNEVRTDISETFKKSKKTQNYEIIKQMSQMFDTELRRAFIQIHLENEERRERTAKEVISKCMSIYSENMEQLLGDKKFVKSRTFDEFSYKAKTLANNHFSEIFGNEEEADTYAPYLLKIFKSIEKLENSIKEENYNKKSEVKAKGSQSIEESLNFYCEQIKSHLNEKVFLTSKNFNQFEQEIRSQSLTLFLKTCEENQAFDEKLVELLKFKLNNAKTDLDSANSRKMEEVMLNTDMVLKSSLNFLQEKIDENINLFSGSENLEEVNKSIKDNTIQFFEQKCIVKEANFLNRYLIHLEKEIDKALVDLCRSFETKNQELNDFYNNTIEEAKNRCFVEVKTLLDGKSLISTEDLTSFIETFSNDVVIKFESMPKQNKFDEIKQYINERIAYEADLMLIKKLAEFYGQKMEETLLTKIFFSRKEFTAIHIKYKEEIVETFTAHKKTVNDDLINEMLAKLNNDLEEVFELLYSQNEQKRESVVEEEIQKNFNLYKDGMSEKLDLFCLENSRFEELTDDSKNKASKQLMSFCEEEEELCDFYAKQLSKLIESAENEFKTLNNNKLIEATKNNSRAVCQSLDHYSDRMNFALKEELFHSNQLFKEYENNVRDESNKIFADNCIHGELEFINKFEMELNNKIKLLKTKFKNSFRKTMDSLESEIIVKMNDVLSQYNQVMYLLLDTLKSEQQFRTKHKEVKAQFIEVFKEKSSLKDNEYKNEKISKLAEAIDKSCNQFHERFLDQMKKSGSLYETKVNDHFASYAEVMKELFSDNSSISEEEIENLNQNLVKDIMSKFENEFLDEEDNNVINSNRRALEIKIMNEFENIKRTNRERNELIEKSDMKLKLKIKEFVAEYEERMEKMLPFCGEETDLIEQHLEIEDVIKQKMNESNPFSNTKSFEPYMIALEVEINKSFNDFNQIFKVNSDKQLLELQNVIINARKYYRTEMKKFYKNANYIKTENLVRNHSSVIERTIAKYQSERGNMSIEKFNNFVKDSLLDIYNDIIEENNKNTPTLPAIGIDLGTTNSCVAFYQTSKPKGKVIIVPNDMGNTTTPSVIAFCDNNHEIIGEAAKEQSYINSRNTIFSAKRLIGRQFDDENVKKDMNLWPFRVVDDGNNIAKISVKVDGTEKIFFPEEISAKILKKLKQTAETYLGCDVKNAVITVPAYFNEAQKEATKDAGKIAGLNVLKIINEPTAAAIAFQLNRSDDLGSRNVLIYDFGGGTFDVVVLVIEKGGIDIKAVGGDNHLGGDDIDANLVEYCLKDFTEKTQITIDKTDEDGHNAIRRLITECEKRKRQLCAANSVVVSLDQFYGGNDLRCELTRDKFEELNKDLFIKSTDLVSQVLADANLDHSDIDDVVLVGGTTRILKIQDMLSDLFYGKPLNHSVNPDEAVAVGAAIQAAILNGTLAQASGLLSVSDVTPMSLGVKVKDGFMSVIIHRNSKVPNNYTKQYETTTDNQKEVDIEIYEGEETMAADNRKLGTFTLSNIPPGPAGEQQIEVKFNINDEGILHVSAKIISSGEEGEILITEHKGRLTNAELQQLIEQET